MAGPGSFEVWWVWALGLGMALGESLELWLTMELGLGIALGVNAGVDGVVGRELCVWVVRCVRVR